jgi:predicted phage terminase large subunit-like protein
MVAAAELERRRRLRTTGLLDFVPLLSPQWDSPKHLEPLTSRFERALIEPIRFLFSVPPQHGKTETVAHGIVWTMLRDPTRSHIYVTYQTKRTREVSIRTRQLAERAGLRPEGTQDLWRLPEGGQISFTSFDGQLGGTPASGLIIVDDPHKNRQEAESSIVREHVWSEFNSSVMTRMHNTTSVVVIHTRWTTDDLIARLEKIDDPIEPERKLWPYTNLPAISEAGELLWPEHKSRRLIEEARARNEYAWWSLFMGQPRPPGGTVFHDVQFYDELPKTYRVAFGLDLAYTAKTRSDYSCAVVLAESGGNYYVLDVKRAQCPTPEFAPKLREIKASYPGAQGLWHTSTTEPGTADLLREVLGFHIRSELARGDPFQRAQPVAAAWNTREGHPGRVFLPRDRPWVEAFVSELVNFTGDPKRHDDQVVALASAYQLLSMGHAEVPRAFPTKFTKQTGGGPVFPEGGKGGGFVW